MTRTEREEIRAAQRRHNLTFRQASDLVTDLHTHEQKMAERIKEIRARRAQEAQEKAQEEAAAQVQAQSAGRAEGKDHS